MKYLKHSFFAIGLLLGTLNCFSQVVITADKTSGCDSLTVLFTIDPMSDTITNILWDLGEGASIAGDSTITHHYSSPGKFSVSALINGSTNINFSDPVYVYTLPDARFAYSDTLELGSYSFVFSSRPQEVDSFTYSYEWRSPGGILNNTSGFVYTFPESGIYTIGLAVSNEFGCEDTFARSIVAADILDAPNVFTPNEDGFNDYFVVKTNGVNLYEFSVYARSGMLVYKSKAAVIQWDGRSSAGKLLSPGAYYYVIKQLDGDVLTDKIGFVHLLL